jgi:hypothetical protein
VSGEVRKLDLADPAPGFDGMVFGGAKMPGGRFLGWTPGKTPDPGTDERSWQLTSGADLVVQVHLRPSGKPEAIRPKIGLHFATRPPSKIALSMELSSTDLDIAAGETDYRVTDSFQLPADVDLISVYPHAHYVGKQLDGYVLLPDGTRRQLIEIDDWDFNWQDAYRLAQPLRLPKGSVIHMDYRYDNSAANPRNPSSPPQRVVYGPNSTDEMAELILELEPVNPADLSVLDDAFMAKWLSGQITTTERKLAAAGNDPKLLSTLAALLARAGQMPAAKRRFEESLALRDDADVGSSSRWCSRRSASRSRVKDSSTLRWRSCPSTPERTSCEATTRARLAVTPMRWRHTSGRSRPIPGWLKRTTTSGSPTKSSIDPREQPRLSQRRSSSRRAARCFTRITGARSKLRRATPRPSQRTGMRSIAARTRSRPCAGWRGCWRRIRTRSTATLLGHYRSPRRPDA